MSSLEDGSSTGLCFPGQGEWKQQIGAQADLQGGSCYLRCGPGAMSTSLCALHDKVQHHRCF